jgi:tetratricopeptide (TPR) repeat protein
MTVTGARPNAAPTLGADELSALEEERDFLLRSLDDLEAEYAAGDVDRADYEQLKDDYTTRAAVVLRTIEARRTRTAPAPSSRSWRRGALWVLGVAVVALVAGVVMARSSGSRGRTDLATGDSVQASRQLLADATQAGASGDFKRAISLYDKVLAGSPANVEAFAYRGWMKFQSQDAAGAEADLDQALTLDPGFSDAHAFRTVVYVRSQRWDKAAAELAALDASKPRQEILDLIERFGVRAKVAEQRVRAVLLVPNPPPLAASGIPAADVRLVAESLADQSQVVDALKLWDIVLAADPNDVRALTYRAWTTARVGVNQQQPVLVTASESGFAKALQLKPGYPDALVFRAFLYANTGRNDLAKADLAKFDAGTDKPRALVDLVDQGGLRRQLGVG